MKLNRKILGTLALLSWGALPVAAKPVRHPVAHVAPTNLVTVTPQGTYLLGNPAARVRLTEYISYTCPHCAHFHEEATAPLQTGFVASGKGVVEILPYIRNPIDMAAALLVECGGAAHFVPLHDAFLNGQAQWMAKLAGVSDVQRARWDNGPVSARMQAMAADLDLYRIAAAHGIARTQADRCLTDQAAMKRIAAQTEAATNAGVEATPSFAIDGVVLTGTYDWAMLAPQLQAR